LKFEQMLLAREFPVSVVAQNYNYSQISIL